MCELSRNALLTSDVFLSHREAPSSETARQRLPQCVGDEGVAALRVWLHCCIDCRLWQGRLPALTIQSSDERCFLEGEFQSHRAAVGGTHGGVAATLFGQAEAPHLVATELCARLSPDYPRRQHNWFQPAALFSRQCLTATITSDRLTFRSR
jgi:hypothetical protein